MKYNILLLLAVVLLSSFQLKNKSEKKTLPENLVTSTMSDQLTEAEKKAGWKLLFDGKTTKGWRGVKDKGFPSGKWKIGNGVLTVLATKKDEIFKDESIITEDQYGDFELKLECKLTPDANSGIKYYVLVDEYKKGDALGLEFQLFDNNAFKSDVAKDTHTMGSLYDLLPGLEVQAKPIGEWNQIRIYSKDNRVEHWLNGSKVLSYIRGGDEFRGKVKQSKFKSYPNFGEAKKGHIMLQDHLCKVDFRNIMIREL